MLKYFSEHICRQLKNHQHRLRSKTGISLENILTQPAIACSKLTIETLEQGVKYVQS